MPTRLPTKTSEAENANKKIRKDRARKPRNNWTRKRLDYAALEAAKLLIGEVPYKSLAGGEFTKDIRVSVLPWSRSGYVDIRVYIKKRSTGQGVLCHMDKWPGLFSALCQVDREIKRLMDQGLIDGPPVESVRQ